MRFWSILLELWEESADNLPKNLTQPSEKTISSSVAFSKSMGSNCQGDWWCFVKLLFPLEAHRRPCNYTSVPSVQIASLWLLGNKTYGKQINAVLTSAWFQQLLLTWKVHMLTDAAFLHCKKNLMSQTLEPNDGNIISLFISTCLMWNLGLHVELHTKLIALNWGMKTHSHPISRTVTPQSNVIFLDQLCEIVYFFTAHLPLSHSAL